MIWSLHLYWLKELILEDLKIIVKERKFHVKTPNWHSMLWFIEAFCYQERRVTKTGQGVCGDWAHNFVHVWFINLLVLAVMLAISAKLVVIFPHASHEHLSSDKSSHISKHLQSSERYHQSLKSLIPPLLNFNLILRGYAYKLGKA